MVSLYTSRGHLDLLKFARNCRKLIVGINSDSSVKLNKENLDHTIRCKKNF